MTALVVVAHPDDETLGAGGTVARYVRAGREVAWLVLGEGSTSRHPRGEADAAALAAQRADCRLAADRLGVATVEHADLTDNAFDTVALLDVARVVEEVVSRVRPSTVLTHHGHDLNVDHRITHEAVAIATRPVPGCPVRTVAAFEVVSSTEWAFDPRGAFTPNVFVDITDTVDVKLHALEAYASETRTAPHPRSPETVRALATVRGATAGVQAAEAFQIVRAVR